MECITSKGKHGPPKWDDNLDCKRDSHGRFLEGPTQEMKNRMRETIRRGYKLGRIPPMLGKHHTKGSIIKMSISRAGKVAWNKGLKRWWKSSTEFKKGEHNGREFTKEFFKTEKGIECIRKSLKACQIKPNKKEQMLISLFSSNNLPYRYVGNGEIIIGRKNPDFIANNKIIELFGKHWHSKEFNKQTPEERINFFKNYGYDTLIIQEQELDNLNSVLERVKEFTWSA